MMHQEIIIAGFGGQGILMAGRILAYAGMLEDKHVSWLPSYGPEMRGGTANCNVIISNEEVGSPLVNRPTVLIAMNSVSFEKFKNNVAEDGIIIFDSSIINEYDHEDRKLCPVNATQRASDLGFKEFSNIILLGTLIKKTNIIGQDSFIQSLKEILPTRKHHMIPDEIKALQIGMEY